MKQTNEIVARATHKDHQIEILEIVEFDMDGNPAVAKKMVLVDTPKNGRQVMHVSPYEYLSELLLMAKMWVNVGCPMAGKWDMDSLLKESYLAKEIIE